MSWDDYRPDDRSVHHRRGGSFSHASKGTKIPEKAISVLSFLPKQRKWQSISCEAGQN